MLPPCLLLRDVDRQWSTESHTSLTSVKENTTPRYLPTVKALTIATIHTSHKSYGAVSGLSLMKRALSRVGSSYRETIRSKGAILSLHHAYLASLASCAWVPDGSIAKRTRTLFFTANSMRQQTRAPCLENFHALLAQPRGWGHCRGRAGTHGRACRTFKIVEVHMMRLPTGTADNLLTPLGMIFNERKERELTKRQLPL